LAKPNWNGCQKCCFCDSLETVQHLFLSCPFAKIVWCMIYLTYNLPPLLTLRICFLVGWTGWKKLIELGYELVYRLYVGLFGRVGFFVTDRKTLFFAGYPTSCALDIIMGIPSPHG
jgi:hypothetical protein